MNVTVIGYGSIGARHARKDDLKTVKELIKKYRFTMVEWFNITR